MAKTIRDYFNIKELVCQDVYAKFGEKAWDFLDPKLLAVLLFIREGIGKPILVNTGTLHERGLRCNLCVSVDAKTAKNQPYISAHVQGKAVDFNVSGMTPAQIRQWLYNNKHRLPYAIRVELNTPTWVHVDVRNYSQTEKLVTFNG